MKDMTVIGGFSRTPAVWLRGVLGATLGLLLISAYFLTAGADEARAQEALTCDRWASVTGHDEDHDGDGAVGTQTDPVRHIPKLANILAPGQTGCLVAGQTFDEPLGEFIIGNAGGTPDNPITIRSSGAPRANIKAQAWLQTTSHDIVFKDLNFVDSYAPDKQAMLIIEGDRIEFEDNDITFSRGMCLNVGELNGQTGEPRDPAEGFVLDHNRIHDCGKSLPLSYPDDPTFSGAHAIYLKYTLGAQITNNHIYDNRFRGLQLYPRAESTRVEHNVFDGNSGNLNIGAFADAQAFSRNNVIENNIITNSTFAFSKDTAQVHGNFPAGTTDTQYGNVVRGNCFFPAYGGEQDNTRNFGGVGYSHLNNVFLDPLYKDRANKDFTLAAGSPCAVKGPQTVVNTAPTITDPKPADGSTTADTTPDISAKVSDAETELVEDNIDLYINGRQLGHLEYGYNQTTDVLFHTPEQPLPDGIIYGVEVVATDAQGSSKTRFWEFMVDATAPIATAPVHSFTTLSTLGTSTVPVKLTWSATDNRSIASYQVQRSVNGGAYTNVALPSATATTISPSLTPGSIYGYRVAATDRVGNVSAWATGPSFKVTSYQESSAAIVDTGTWTTSLLTNSYGGSVQHVAPSARGNNATFTVPAGSRNVEWVSTRGNRGKAEVWLDGVQQDASPSVTGIQPFDLYSPSLQLRKVVFSKVVSPTTSHKLEVRVLGQKNASSTSTRVDIDAFVTTS